MSRLPPRPDLDWNAEGAPSARAFGDVYFSRDGGLSEAEAVFLGGCGLPAAWRGRRCYAVLELGFGAGLNALAAWRRWAETRAPGARLFFTSIEAFPMAREDAARALAPYVALAPYARRLLEAWPVRAFAPQRLWFDDFALTIVHGQAESALRALDGAYDAFFLDGFAPARNPDMWSEPVACELARLAAPGARLASYSVAGGVRRALTQAGWTVEKAPGFGAKRERLEARLSLTPARAESLFPRGGHNPARIAIVGAGIAGAACAHALARRGGDVIVLDSAAHIAAGASGNRAGLIMPRLDRGRGPVQETFLAAYLAAPRAYAAARAFDPCGVIERSRPDLIADPPLLPDWLEAESGEAVLHHAAGVAFGPEAVRAWLRCADVRLGACVASLARRGEIWTLCDANGAAIAEADAVILANGAGLNGFAQTAWLDLRLTAGQIEQAGLIGGPPARALIDESYAAPVGDGLVFGATFDRIDQPISELSDHARTRNLAALAALAPDLARRVRRESIVSRASVRAAAPDYAPILGLAPDAPAWLARQAGLAYGRPPDLSAPAPAHAGLYLIGALGARGLTLAPLLGEELASEMYADPAILPHAARDALHPARFLQRRLRKGEGARSDENS